MLTKTVTLWAIVKDFFSKVEYIGQSAKNSQEPLIGGKSGGSRGISCAVYDFEEWNGDMDEKKDKVERW